MDTRWVYWRGKFGGEAVLIRAATFDPAVHRDAPWPDDGDGAPAATPEPTPAPKRKRG